MGDHILPKVNVNPKELLWFVGLLSIFVLFFSLQKDQEAVNQEKGTDWYSRKTPTNLNYHCHYSTQNTLSYGTFTEINQITTVH